MAIESLKLAIDHMHYIEAMLEKAKEELWDALTDVPGHITGSIQERNEMIRYLYWRFPEIPATWIAAVFGLNTYQVTQIAGKAVIPIKCEACGVQLTVNSRTEANELLRKQRIRSKRKDRNWRFLCPSCWEKEREEDRKKSIAEREAMEKRLCELRTMPYHEYLKTPEWQARRLEHLRSVNFRCQVCNRNDLPLHVHHRTYEHRGEERFKDLIVLCEQCHKLFHDQGKLLKGDEDQ